MDIKASIIDQQVESLAERLQPEFQTQLGLNLQGDRGRLKSLAFIHLCVRSILDLNDLATLDCIVDGGQDFGVDGIYASEEQDGEFTVYLFQGKYKQKLDRTSHFPEEGIKSLINAIQYLFDPSINLNQSLNRRLQAKVEEIRSLIRDGYIPQVRAIACNNGLRWNDQTDRLVQIAGFGDQVEWEHLNPDRLIKLQQSKKPVNDKLQLSGKILVEDIEFNRILVGRVAISEIAALVDRHGERLFERNIRRYLGLQSNRVNDGIRQTIETNANYLYFYNNGLTLICDKFEYNALQGSDHQVHIQNLQIINGGQTCMTIYKTLLNAQRRLFNETDPSNAYILIRLYQLSSFNTDLVQQITFATNNQNPVDLRDLKANDQRQEELELDLEQLGYRYLRKRGAEMLAEQDITSSEAAESVLAVWRKAPHQAKFQTREHFGKLYNRIFTHQLNGAQVGCAVLLCRWAENRRRHPESSDPDFVRYAAYFVAMQMGEYLLQDLRLSNLTDLNHRNFPKARDYIQRHGLAYFQSGVVDIQRAISALYSESAISLQQLAATFRRGDLIQWLNRASPQSRQH
ncbi:MAG: abortive phage resistance protein [Oscillatoriales cyanobacterium]|nr:MAG: abortive phage resistance protein [Oscillatoriales cyanobacterium]